MAVEDVGGSYYAEAVGEEATLSLDERLAQQLAIEEEEKYAEFLKSIEEKDDGIVFSVSINAGTQTLEDGSPAHQDDLERFEPFRERFGGSAPGWRITKFHWFVNPYLERKFENARAVLQSMDRPAKEELLLSHGTPQANFDSILRRGLIVAGTQGVEISIGCASGVGIYLAERAGSAIGYTKGANRIFACRVIPGKVTTNVEHIRKIPKNLEPGAERYDSYHGPYVKGSSLYVVRCADLVLPCYMIEFEKDQPEAAVAAQAVPAPAPPPKVVKSKARPKSKTPSVKDKGKTKTSIKAKETARGKKGGDVSSSKETVITSRKRTLRSGKSTS